MTERYEHEPLGIDPAEVPDLIRRGLTPAAVDLAYQFAGVGKLSSRAKVERRTILALARRWGIRE